MSLEQFILLAGNHKATKPMKITRGESGASVFYKNRGVVHFFKDKDGRMCFSYEGFGASAPDFVKDALEKIKL